MFLWLTFMDEQPAKSARIPPIARGRDDARPTPDGDVLEAGQLDGETDGNPEVSAAELAYRPPELPVDVIRLGKILAPHVQVLGAGRLPAGSTVVVGRYPSAKPMYPWSAARCTVSASRPQ
jgi:hypothetical protein